MTICCRAEGGAALFADEDGLSRWFPSLSTDRTKCSTLMENSTAPNYHGQLSAIRSYVERKANREEAADRR